MSVRHRMKRLDDRTGRLERAVNMTNDGMIPGIRVRRGEEDKVHPQSVPRVVGLDRALLKAPKPADTAVRNFVYQVGYTSNSNFERPSMPACNFGSTYGTYTYITAGSLGYGERGYGTFGYGGFLDGEGVPLEGNY